MRIKALVSFSGAFSMAPGQETDCSDETVLQDLLGAGYVEKVAEQGGDTKNPAEKVKGTEKTTAKGGKSNEGKRNHK